MPLLDIRNLTLDITTPTGIRRAVDRVNIRLTAGEICSLVGESGSGKTLIAKAILGITNTGWEITADRFKFDNIDLLKLSPKARRRIISENISMIFQETQSCLDPSMTIGRQLITAIPKRTLKCNLLTYFKSLKSRAIELLHRVGIKEHKEIMRSYPFELTEGECQKVMIAIALANQPKLLIADEPTNAMEAATEIQIFRLLASLNQNHGTTILLINHDLQMVTRWTDRINVLYCGQMVEMAPSEKLAVKPHHPYTEALIKAIPDFQKALPHKSQLYALPGVIPSLENLPIGCRLGPRCPYAQKKCIITPSLTEIKDHAFACHFPLHMEQTNEYRIKG